MKPCKTRGCYERKTFHYGNKLWLCNKCAQRTLLEIAKEELIHELFDRKEKTENVNN